MDNISGVLLIEPNYLVPGTNYLVLTYERKNKDRFVMKMITQTTLYFRPKHIPLWTEI